MSRPLRLQYAGALYHVIARGNNRGRIVRDERDVAAFLTSLGTTCRRYSWRVFAWCIMPNHYHLILETIRPTLSRGMLRHNGVFAQHFNQRHGRVGHVFQARFKSFVVERERYLVALLRYVELNPCRAALVKTPTDWPWSSVHVSLGLTPPPPWSAVRDVWARFGLTRRQAIAAYGEFLMAGMRVDVAAPPVTGGIFVGSDAFAADVRQHCSETTRLSAEIPLQQRVRRPSIVRLAVVHRNADAFAKAAYLEGFSLTDIAAHLGVHYSTASRMANRTRPRLRQGNPALGSRGALNYTLT